VIGGTVEQIATGRAAVAYDGAGALVLVDMEGAGARKAGGPGR
jgi:hypothetical protein